MPLSFVPPYSLYSSMRDCTINKYAVLMYQPMNGCDNKRKYTSCAGTPYMLATSSLAFSVQTFIYCTSSVAKIKLLVLTGALK